MTDLRVIVVERCSRAVEGDGDATDCPFINSDFGNCNLAPDVQNQYDRAPDGCPLRSGAFLVQFKSM